MRFHKFREHGDRIEVCVHMDETRVLDDGTPDPGACLDLEWAREEPKRDGETVAQFNARQAEHREMVAREAKLLAADEWAIRNPSASTPLAAEGSTV